MCKNFRCVKLFVCKKFLHAETITRFYPQTFLHADAFTHRRFYTQTVLHTDVLTHRRFYTQTFLHTDPFTHRRFYTENFTHRCFYTETFTHRRFYTLRRTTWKSQFCRSFWRSNLISCERVATFKREIEKQERARGQERM